MFAANEIGQPPINITCNRLVRPTSTRAGKRQGYRSTVPGPGDDLISDTLQMSNCLSASRTLSGPSKPFRCSAYSW